MKRMTFLFVVLLLAVWAMPMTGWAAESLGKIGENVAGNMPGLAKMVLYGSFLVGLIFGVTGLIKFKGYQRSQEGLGPAIVCVVIGAVLLSIGTFLASGSMTIFGADETSKAASALGL